MGQLFRHCLPSLVVAVSALLSKGSAASAHHQDECGRSPLEVFQRAENQICLPSEKHQTILASGENSEGPSSWAHEPFCVKDRAGVDKYCLYTSTEFNHMRGVSFIIRPENLPDVTGYMQDANLTLRGKAYLNAENPELAYNVVNVDGKGRAVVARRPIQRGELVIVSFPAVVIDQELEIGPDPDIDEEDRLQLYELAFARLSDKYRALGLAASTGGNIHEDIMRTNGFGISIGGREYSGLSPETARINHACSPNAVIRFAKKSLATEAIAVKDVAVGEELSISYIPPELPSAKRLEMLNTIYKFSCTCPLCTAEPSQRAASDAKRELLVELKSRLKDSTKLQSLEEAVALTREFLTLVQEENLHFKIKEYYSDLMWTFYKLGDAATAIQFAEGALRRNEELWGGEDEFKEAIRGNLAVLKRMQRRAEAEAEIDEEE